MRLQVLSSPTTKDFTNIMLFLVRQIDPNLLKSGFGKIEEEIPQLYKRLRYPFALSKSNLTAVGSPHTWPAILAAVCWIVELLNYSEKAETARIEVGIGGERARSEADFFDYVATSYKHFMAGDDAMCEAVDAEKASEFQFRAATVQEEYDRLAAANEALSLEISQLRSQPSPLIAAKEKLAETQADKDKFLKLLDNLQAHKSSLQRKVQERQADVSAHSAELASVEAENETLRNRIATQVVHPADVVRMNQERARLESEHRMLTAQRETADAKATETSVQLETRLTELETIIAEYHTRADRLQLLPATAKRAEGVSFEINLARNATSASTMINVDLKGIIKPAVVNVKDRYAAKARTLAEEALSLSEKRDAAADLLTERSEECANAAKIYKDLEAQYKEGKEELEAGVAAALAQVEGLAAEVYSLRGACAAGLAESEERLKSLQSSLEEVQRLCEVENATVHRDLAAALEAILNHKVSLQSKLKSTSDRLLKVMKDIERTPLPTVV